jgi:CRISPR-associated endonuclease/helicase Cas3
LEQVVSEHLRGVASLSRSYGGKVGLERAGELIGLVHDLGKYGSTFQNYLKSATGIIDLDADDYVDAGSLKGKSDHSSAGAQYVWQEMQALDPSAFSCNTTCSFHTHRLKLMSRST